MHSAEEFRDAFAALLPRGPAWPRGLDSVLMQILAGQAVEWSRLDARAEVLLATETDPRFTTEMLDSWERAFGLPEECMVAPTTMADRRRALVRKVTELGGQSRAFFIALAEYLGYSITITEFQPWTVGISEVGGELEFATQTIDDENGGHLIDENGLDITSGQMGQMLPGQPEIGAEEMRFYWVVNVGGTRLTWFRVGQDGGELGVDPFLQLSLAEDLECIIRKYQPLHGQVLFNYSGLTVPDPEEGLP